MSILAIPIFPEDASFEEIITLDGINYKLRIYWNTRDEFWYMDISLTDDTQILMGIKLVVNYRLIPNYVNENKPTGDFILYDASESKIPCGRNELGTRCILLYITADDSLLQ